MSQQFKVVAVVGPRQSGKTTLVRAQFSEKSYVNFENPNVVETMGKNGYQHAIANFDKDILAKKMIKNIEKIVS